jgi:hypothetical protein
MENDLHLGLFVIKVLCLIVIAMSAYKVAYCSDSYFTDPTMSKASLAHLAERSDFMGSGQVEAPVFWNLGSVEETNELLQKAATQVESTEGFKSRDVKKMKDFQSIEQFVGAGL